MQMVPHERSLVQRMQDKDQPFALVGVNADRDRDQTKKRVEKDKINWRSFWDGGTPGGKDSGAIARAWKVEGFPTIYVLDADGVIRYRDVRNEAMERAVESLLKEMKSRNK
jgi:hypothetical protein